MNILLDKPELDTVLVNVTVSDGNVRLWGVVENADQAAAAESAAKMLPGVKSVKTISAPARCRACRCMGAVTSRRVVDSGRTVI